MKLFYGISNIRRIKDLPEIEICPITILVGRNSAGKSTFLRTLPLIRQSIQARSSAPILWFGNLVDFGDANVAIGEAAGERKATFSFTIHELSGENTILYYARAYYRSMDSVKVNRVSVRYTISEDKNKTALATIELDVPEEEIKLCLQLDSNSRAVDEILLNDIRLQDFNDTFVGQQFGRNLFEAPVLFSQNVERERKTNRLIGRGTVFAELLMNLFVEYTRGKLKDRTIEREVWRILSSNTFDAESIKQLADTSRTVTFKNIYNHLISGKKSELKERVFEIQKLSRGFTILEILEERLTEFFQNVRYLEPVRAASERYYRKQELEISEIAPNGSNFPMFLASLAPKELEEFSSWIKSLFGYGVYVDGTAGHISIALRSGKRTVNVTDTGYGVSQILPVLGMIWWAQEKKFISSAPHHHRRLSLQTVAIEQPELHLHPAHQAKLADVLVSVSQAEHRDKSNSTTRFIVETHSEALINRLGELVEEGDIGAEDVQIVVFSAGDDLDSPTEISVSSFDDKGALKNWPFGFFNYTDR